jgi:hypothetical protein
MSLVATDLPTTDLIGLDMTNPFASKVAVTEDGAGNVQVTVDNVNVDVAVNNQNVDANVNLLGDLIGRFKNRKNVI